MFIFNQFVERLGVFFWDDALVLRIDDEFQAWILLNNQSDWHQAQLLSGSLIHRWGCFLQWQVDERVMWQVVLPDMLDSETFRRLRVWAMFGQKV